MKEMIAVARTLAVIPVIVVYGMGYAGYATMVAFATLPAALMMNQSITIEEPKFLNWLVGAIAG